MGLFEATTGRRMAQSRKRMMADLSSQKAVKDSEMAAVHPVIAKSRETPAEARMKAATARMRQFPRQANGLHTDAVKSTPEYKAAKQESDKAFQALRAENKARTKVTTAQQSAVKTHAKLAAHNLEQGNDNAARYHAQKALAANAESKKATHPVIAKSREASAEGSSGKPAHEALGQKAAVKSASANAKPSLMGHTSAANAHQEAAQAYQRAGLPAKAAQHEDLAQHHRTMAKQVSHQIHALRAKKIKPVGPGQQHGVDGKFMPGR